MVTAAGAIITLIAVMALMTQAIIPIITDAVIMSMLRRANIAGIRRIAIVVMGTGAVAGGGPGVTDDCEMRE